MLDQIHVDRLDNAIDRFEERWATRSPSDLSEILRDFGFTGDLDALVELARVDIELRYRDGLPVDLDRYLDEDPGLLQSPIHLGQIAFEDFRSRQVQGLSVDASRYRRFPGVPDEVWFRRLAVESPVGRSLVRDRRASGASDPRSDDGSAPKVRPSLRDALAAAGFQLVEMIGQGALGSVYLARQDELANRYVVLKVVSAPMSEPQNMALLQHTNIVPIYSFTQIASDSVICMPYAGRLTLARFLKDTRGGSYRGGPSLISTVHGIIESTRLIGSPEVEWLDPRFPSVSGTSPAADERAVSKPMQELRNLDSNRLATWIFKRLSSALAHAHARGVLHNDLKPANVLIRNDGEPALLDFNLSQSLGRANSVGVGGTLPYMSPESLRALMGCKQTPHEASDIYSMGVMLFEFVTGQLPHRPPTSMAPIDLEASIGDRMAVPRWPADDATATGLRHIIDRCLAFEPTQRYASADALHTDLQREHDDLPLIEAREPRRSRIRKWFRRHPSATSAGSVATILAALLVPTMGGTLAWIEQSRQLASVAAMEAFEQDSERTLAVLLANRRGNDEALIRRGFQTLQQHGILDASGTTLSVAGNDGDAHIAGFHESAFRHVIVVASLETKRLQQNRDIAPGAKRGLGRLDELIRVGERLRGDAPSRSIGFLKWTRAGLVGDEVSRIDLAADWRSLQPETDAEKFLEAIRLLTFSDDSAAARILTSLADRGSVPSGLRWIALGQSQFDAGRFDDASVSLTQAVDRHPNVLELWNLRGANFMELHQGSRADADFTRAIRLAPNNARSWMLRGSLRTGRGELDDAIADLTKVLELVDGHIPALLNRSRAYRLAGQLTEAERDLQAAMVSENINVPALLARAQIRKHDDPQAALQDLELADRLQPNHPPVLSGMGKLLTDELDRNDDAIGLLHRVAQMRPADERAMVDYAVVLARGGRHDEARAQVDAVFQFARSSRSLYQAACVCALNPVRESQTDAVVFLAKAVREGYPVDRVRIDPDLASLRNMPGFLAIARVGQLAKANDPEGP